MILLPTLCSISFGDYCPCVRGSRTDSASAHHCPAPSTIWYGTPSSRLQAAEAWPPIPSCCQCCQADNPPREPFIFPIYKGTSSKTRLLEVTASSNWEYSWVLVRAVSPEHCVTVTAYPAWKGKSWVRAAARRRRDARVTSALSQSVAWSLLDWSRSATCVRTEES